MKPSPEKDMSMMTTSKLAQDVARGVYAHDAEFFQRDFDAAIADAIRVAVKGSRVMFSAPNSQLAAPDDVSCPKCGGTKPTCCSCPAPAPQPVLDAGEWQLHNDGSVRICLVLPDGNCKQIAEAEIIGWTREEALAHAAQIVSDHRSATAVPKLIQALKEARALIGSTDELARLIAQAPVLKVIDEALAGVQGKEQG